MRGRDYQREEDDYQEEISWGRPRQPQRQRTAHQGVKKAGFERRNDEKNYGTDFLPEKMEGILYGQEQRERRFRKERGQGGRRNRRDRNQGQGQRRRQQYCYPYGHMTYQERQEKNCQLDNYFKRGPKNEQSNEPESFQGISRSIRRNEVSEFQEDTTQNRHVNQREPRKHRRGRNNNPRRRKNSQKRERQVQKSEGRMDLRHEISKVDSHQSSLWVNNTSNILEGLNESAENELDQEEFPSFISEIHQDRSGRLEQKRQELQQKMKEEPKQEIGENALDILQKIKGSCDWEERSVWIRVSQPTNVREVVIKEVKLVYLGCSIELTLSEQGIVAKKLPVPVEHLTKYIRFTQINYSLPAQAKQNTWQWQLCKIRVKPQQKPQSQNTFIKRRQQPVAKSDPEEVIVQYIQLRCSGCEVKNIIAANSALSCKQCSDPMALKIHPTYLKSYE